VWQELGTLGSALGHAATLLDGFCCLRSRKKRREEGGGVYGWGGGSVFFVFCFRFPMVVRGCVGEGFY